MQVNTMLPTDQDPEEVTTMTKEKYICHTLRKERNTTRMYLEWNPHGQEGNTDDQNSHGDVQCQR